MSLIEGEMGIKWIPVISVSWHRRVVTSRVWDTLYCTASCASVRIREIEASVLRTASKEKYSDDT